MPALPSLPLDARRLAMLKAMGVELWWQRPAAAPTRAPAAPPAASAGVRQPKPERAIAVRDAATPGAAIPQAPASPPAAAAPTPVGNPTPVPARPAAAQRAESPAPATAPQALAPATVLRLTPPQPLHGVETTAGTTRPGPRWWLVVDDCASLGNDAAAAGELLRNMVRAMGLGTDADVWLSWVERRDDAQAPADAAPQPLAVHQSLQAQIVIALGRDAAEHLLAKKAALGNLRQQDHVLQAVPVVVSFAPSYLLRAPHAKRHAWQDLKKALVLAERLDTNAATPPR